jgi:hypothetical protein
MTPMERAAPEMRSTLDQTHVAEAEAEIAEAEKAATNKP